MTTVSKSLGLFGGLPADLLTSICAHLQMSDVVNVAKLDSHLEGLVRRRIYREIKALRVLVKENESTMNFIHKDGRTTELKIEESEWEDVLKHASCIHRLEFDISPDQSTSQVFHVLKRAPFALKHLKIHIGDGKNAQKLNVLHQRCIALVSQHRSTLCHLEASTSDEQHVIIDVSSDVAMELNYEQSAEPKPSEQMKQTTNHYFVYNLFHALLEYRSIPHVTLHIGNKFDANLALQKAFQIAIPHSKRKILERLTIEFGNSLKAATEEEMKKVLLRHVDEFHFTTPNLQHFHCSLPHDEIDLSQDFLAMLNDPVRKSRKSASSRPYNSSFSLRTVRCK